MFTQCWYNVGPASHTVSQHCTGIGWMFRVCWDVSPWRSAWRVHDPVWNQRRYTGLNINSAMPPLTWSSSHIERKETMKFIWKIQAWSTWLKPGSSASLARQSWALAMRHDPPTLDTSVNFAVGIYTIQNSKLYVKHAETIIILLPVLWSRSIPEKFDEEKNLNFVQHFHDSGKNLTVLTTVAVGNTVYHYCKGYFTLEGNSMQITSAAEIFPVNTKLWYTIYTTV